MISKLLTPIMVIAAIFSANAQDTTKVSSFKLSGAADVYYRYNFHNPRAAPYNNLTSFTNSHNSFELGMASLKVEHNTRKVGMVADVGFGRRAEEFSYNDAKSTFLIKQFYITYAPVEKVKFTMGSWATHVGYELVDAYLNRNYSMSYMFSYGPFFHTGAKAEFAVGKKSTVMVGVCNPTDFKSASAIPKMAIAQFATASKDDKLKTYLNYQGGKMNDSLKLNQADVVLTYPVSDKISLGYNGTYQSRQSATNVKGKWNDANSWWGSALYVNYDPLPWFGVTLREEYINDKKSVLGFNGDVFASTLSTNFKIENLTIIGEVRADNINSSPGIFTKNNGMPTKSTSAFVVAAVYHF